MCIKYGEERRIWNIKLPKRKTKKTAEEYIKNLIAKFRESKSIYCHKCGCMGCTCIPPENIIEDISIWKEGSGSTDMDMESIINGYFFSPTYLDHVETFILKHMNNFTPEMLTDVIIMWNAIGGDPEYKLTLKKDIE